MASYVMVCTWVWLRVLQAGASDAKVLGSLLRMPISAMRCDCRSFLGESGFSSGLGCGKTLRLLKFNGVGVTGGEGALCILGENLLL
jgi:hypothetical protein